MTKEEGTAIEILGKIYQIKCPQTEIESLQSAAVYLEEKMRHLRDTGKVLSLDRIAVITALNITHQYLSLENQQSHNAQSIQQRLQDIQSKLDGALTSQVELVSAD